MLYAALRESGIDAVDGSSTGTSVPWMRALAGMSVATIGFYGMKTSF
jgi:hypothetical protein